MAEKYQPEGVPPTARETLIERATDALDEARNVLDWAQDNAHGKEHWRQIYLERSRYEEVRAGLEAAAAIPDAPIQAPMAEGYRDYVVGKYDWRGTEAEVVAAPRPQKADARPTVRVARHMLRLVRGGKHESVSMSSKRIHETTEPVNKSGTKNEDEPSAMRWGRALRALTRASDQPGLLDWLEENLSRMGIL